MRFIEPSLRIRPCSSTTQSAASVSPARNSKGTRRRRLNTDLGQGIDDFPQEPFGDGMVHGELRFDNLEERTIRIALPLDVTDFVKIYSPPRQSS